jgi:hypothetical protein
MRTRNGKIARLPRHLREQLNVRLECSEPSPLLLAWLNALPEVREIVRRDFGGEPVTKHNLSQWRRGGFQDWLARRHFLEAWHEEISRAGGNGAPADTAATALAAHYGRLLLHWDGECTPEFEASSRVLHGFCRGVTELQRQAHRTACSDLATEEPKGNSTGEAQISPQSSPVAACSTVSHPVAAKKIPAEA